MNEFAELPNGKHKRLFSIEDFKKLLKAKILSIEESVELVEGELLQRPETVSDELIKAEAIAKSLKTAFGNRAVVKIKPSVLLFEIQCLKPSIAVLRPSSVNGQEEFVEKEDVFFVIELTDFKFNYTENPRARYYGKFNFPEVWFINTHLSLIEVCTQPNFGYSRCRTYLPNDICQSETASDLQIEAGKILG